MGFRRAGFRGDRAWSLYVFLSPSPQVCQVLKYAPEASAPAVASAPLEMPQGSEPSTSQPGPAQPAAEGCGHGDPAHRSSSTACHLEKFRNASLAVSVPTRLFDCFYPFANRMRSA